MSSALSSKRGSGVALSGPSSASPPASSAAAVRARGPTGSQRSNSAHTARSHSGGPSSTAAASAQRGAQPAGGAEVATDADEAAPPPLEVGGRGAAAAGLASGGSAAADTRTSSVLTVGALEAAAVPDGYAGAASRHVKDEIDELLYQLSVKEKEIRISRGSVQTEVANIRRNIGKMQRDADDLVRQQNSNIASMGKAR